MKKKLPHVRPEGLLLLLQQQQQQQQQWRRQVQPSSLISRPKAFTSRGMHGILLKRRLC